MSYDFSAIGGAKDLANRGDFIGPGASLLILKEYGTRNTEAGTVIYANFCVETSEHHKAGDFVSAAWRVSQPGWQGENDRARAKQFIGALLNKTDGAQISAAGGQLADKAKQPGRGLRVKVFGRNVTTKNGKTFCDVTFEHVVQTGEQIAAARAMLDRGETPRATAPVAAPVVQAPVVPSVASQISDLLGDVPF